MNIKIYGDGADKDVMIAQHNRKEVDGFTTNPTLMKRSGITDYMKFAKDVLSEIKDVSISFEVFSDEVDKMYEQALKLNSLGKNVWVKIPITNTKGVETAPLIRRLTDQGVKVNVTAIFTLEQVKTTFESINENTPAIVSVFAGRIANAGVDPEPIMKESVSICASKKLIEVLWASPREAFNIIQADRVGCHIITVTPDLVEASKTFGKDLNAYSLETVEMFYNDAKESGFKI
tara:strand:- start:1986 stop:2684 length:699 start_codon:yes stop_codon:yes gene_type:complete